MLELDEVSRILALAAALARRGVELAEAGRAARGDAERVADGASSGGFTWHRAALGTSACPPYHLAIVVGGLSAEMTLKTVKYASARYYDSLPTSGSDGGRAFRDVELEGQLHEMTQKMGIGAQFGGKYFCHDVRVIRLPRHGASCPVGERGAFFAASTQPVLTEMYLCRACSCQEIQSLNRVNGNAAPGSCQRGWRTARGRIPL